MGFNLRKILFSLKKGKLNQPAAICFLENSGENWLSFQCILVERALFAAQGHPFIEFYRLGPFFLTTCAVLKQISFMCP